MAATKKRGRPSKADTAKKKQQEIRAAEKKRIQQRHALIFFILGLIFTALAFVEGQNAWYAVHTVLFGIFGIMAFVIGPLMLYLAVVFSLGKQMPAPQIWKAAFLFFSVSGALLLFGSQTVAYDYNLFLDDITLLYNDGILRIGGGVFSALLGWPLYRFCGEVAAKIMIVLLIIIAAMIVTGRTVLDIVNAVKKSSEKVKELHEKNKFNRELMQETAEIPLPLAPPDVNAESNAAQLSKAAETSSIDIPLGDETRSKIDVPLDAAPSAPVAAPPAAAPVSGNTRIDIPLGPQTAAAPLDIDIITPTKRRGTGPAADIVGEVFERDKKINDKFADFGGDIPRQKQEITNAVEPGQSGQKPATGVTPPTASKYVFPSINYLEKDTVSSKKDNTGELRANANILVETLESFGVKAKVINYSRGPTVTRYELQPEAGVRLNRIVNLSDDLALNLAAMGVRIEAPIPGKSAVGIEIPNKELAIVRLRTVLSSPAFRDSDAPLTIALGTNLNGDTMVGDLSKMPHLLISGSTGMGKSVFINSMLVSLVYKSSPENLQLILIDPKMVEFTVYHGLPHLSVPVVTEPSKAAGALNTAVAEMMRRYRLFAESGVRSIEEYNNMVERKLAAMDSSEEEEGEEELVTKPRMLVVIDELADLMMTAPREVEGAICRIAQMGRAAGIHLVVATQRPSVDVITGTIKNNIPTRIAFRVSSQVDSRTILDTGGAEKLIGRGDMLFQPVGQPKAIRIQGCYVSEDEVATVIGNIKKHAVAQYNEALMNEIEQNAVEEKGKSTNINADGADTMLEAAIEVVVEEGKASTSFLQRRLKIGYSRAASMIDEMEEMGIVGPPNGSKPRDILMSKQQWYERQANLPAE